jgi:hypothetical protein
MDRRRLGRLPLAAAGAAFLSCATCATTASAHVKWFCAYDVAGQPRGLENVLCQDFEALVGLAIALLMGGCLLEGTFIGAALIRALDRITVPLRANTEILVRATCGFFFVALWTMGGIILTPELKTSVAAISWLQLAVAVGLIWRQTLPLAGLGIATLFAIAVHDYGIFHLADYPIFLGIAAYLALTGLNRDLFGIRPLDIARFAAGMTLMWASIEKWAYPEWSFPLLLQHPRLSLGFDDEFFMRAAGVIEFTLAFSLVWTPLVRRMSAIMLVAMFISATFEFGKLDVIGHAPIVVVLLAIAGDAGVGQEAPAPSRRLALAGPLAYCVALAAFLAVYYVAHALMYNTQII